MRVEVRQGSLTDGNESVLVNASNTNAQLGSGVSSAIRAACGKGYQQYLFDALQRVFGGPMAPGEILFTNAGTHPHAKWVAHVAVMDYRDGFNGSSFPTMERIERACERLWPRIDSLGGPQSVAMVALGAGTGNLGVVEPMRIAAQTLRRTATKHIERVCFYGFALQEYVATAEVIASEFPEVRASLPAEVVAMFDRR